MSTRRLFCGNIGLCPWKKLCRVLVAIAILGCVGLMVYSTLFLRPRKLLSADSNVGRLQAEILGKNPLAGMTMTKAVKPADINTASVKNSTGSSKAPKKTFNSTAKSIFVPD